MSNTRRARKTRRACPAEPTCDHCREGRQHAGKVADEWARAVMRDDCDTQWYPAGTDASGLQTLGETTTVTGVEK